MVNLPDLITPEELAAHAGWSPRRIRQIARDLGQCRVVGNKMLLSQQDVDAIMEATRPCPSNSTSEAKSGTTGAALPVGGYVDLHRHV